MHDVGNGLQYYDLIKSYYTTAIMVDKVLPLGVTPFTFDRQKYFEKEKILITREDITKWEIVFIEWAKIFKDGDQWMQKLLWMHFRRVPKKVICFEFHKGRTAIYKSIRDGLKIIDDYLIRQSLLNTVNKELNEEIEK